MVSANGTQTFRGRNHRTDSREPALASSADGTTEGGTCSKPPHFAAGVDACPRTSRSAECPCTHVAIAELPRTDSRPLESGAPIGYCGWFDRIVAAAFALFPRWHDRAVSQNAAPANIPPKSIAVLPFRNLSEDKDNEFFSDGISEELLNLLSKMPQLKVAARTSSFSFKGKQIEIPEIARQLHVANVLEGSVRKSGDQLRITAQLIRAAEVTIFGRRPMIASSTTSSRSRTRSRVRW